MLKRFLGFAFWAVSILLVTAPLVTVLGQSGCGGCPGKSCVCGDGTTQPTSSAPCSCPETCASHGGYCSGAPCKDASAVDGAVDAVADAPTDAVASEAAADGGLQSGDLCDLQNDQCASGLKCCTEPTHIVDASTHDICAPVDDGGACPLYP